VPTNSIRQTAAGGLVLGTELGVLYRAPGATTWSRLGGNFPLTTVMDVAIASNGDVYAATHGRGIWSIPLP
jgi:ligand-binding sensor domain-containing protein